MTDDEAIAELRQSMNRLRGQLFQWVEMLDAPDRQESAAKGLIRTLTYAAQADIEAQLRR
jgi:hypothetical protein